MRSLPIIIALGTFLQLVIYAIQAVSHEFFTSTAILAPFPGIVGAITLVVGLLVDLTVGAWSVRTINTTRSSRRSQAILRGALTAMSTRIIATFVGTFLLAGFIIAETSLQDIIQEPNRGVALLNLGLIAITPTCSAAILGAVFGALGGLWTNSLHQGDEVGESSQ